MKKYVKIRKVNIFFAIIAAVIASFFMANVATADYNVIDLLGKLFMHTTVYVIIACLIISLLITWVKHDKVKSDCIDFHFDYWKNSGKCFVSIIIPLVIIVLVLNPVFKSNYANANKSEVISAEQQVDTKIFTVENNTDNYYYIVKEGDTLSQIAHHYKVSVDKLKEQNAEITDENKISVGQEILIKTER
ncbi:LysM domain protein [compost metagenome]